MSTTTKSSKRGGAANQIQGLFNKTQKNVVVGAGSAPQSVVTDPAIRANYGAVEAANADVAKLHRGFQNKTPAVQQPPGAQLTLEGKTKQSPRQPLTPVVNSSPTAIQVHHSPPASPARPPASPVNAPTPTTTNNVSHSTASATARPHIPYPNTYGVNSGLTSINNILEKNDYKVMGEPICIRDDRGFGVCYIKAYDSNGIIVYVSMEDIVGAFELQGQLVNAYKQNQTTNIPQSAINNAVQNSQYTGGIMTKCGDSYCAIENRDEGTAVTKYFEREETDSDVKSENKIDVDAIIQYPIVYAREIERDPKDTRKRILNLYNEKFTKLSKEADEKTAATIEKVKQLGAYVNRFKSNQDVVIKTLKNDREKIIQKIDKFRGSKDEEDAKKFNLLKRNIVDRNFLFEGYLHKINQFNRQQLLLDEMMNKIISLNNELVASHNEYINTIVSDPKN